MKRLLTLLAVIGSLSLGACAFTPKTFDPKLTMVSNPAQGIAIKIVSVEDERIFGTFQSGHCADNPSVDGDYHDKALTSRVIARMGCKYERSNVLLPEDQTVASLMRVVVENAFKENGYRIIPSNIQDKDAVELSVKIKESWASGINDGIGFKQTAYNSISIQKNNVVAVNLLDHLDEYTLGLFEVGSTLFIKPYMKGLDNLKSKLKEQIKNHSFTADNQTASVQ